MRNVIFVILSVTFIIYSQQVISAMVELIPINTPVNHTVNEEKNVTAYLIFGRNITKDDMCNQINENLSASSSISSDSADKSEGEQKTKTRYT